MHKWTNCQQCKLSHLVTFYQHKCTEIDWERYEINSHYTPSWEDECNFGTSFLSLKLRKQQCEIKDKSDFELQSYRKQYLDRMPLSEHHKIRAHVKTEPWIQFRLFELSNIIKQTWKEIKVIRKKFEMEYQKKKFWVCCLWLRWL